MGFAQSMWVSQRQTINVLTVTQIAKLVQVQLQTALHAFLICALIKWNKLALLFARKTFKYMINRLEYVIIVTVTAPHVQATLLLAQHVIVVWYWTQITLARQTAHKLIRSLFKVFARPVSCLAQNAVEI